MNTNEYEESLMSVMLNVSRINGAGIKNLFAAVSMDDDDISVTVGRSGPTYEKDKIVTSCPDREFAQYVNHVCKRWLEKMRAERLTAESQTGEGGEA